MSPGTPAHTGPAPRTVDFRAKHFIGAADLAGLLDGGRPPILLDIRFRLGLADPRKEYDAGHLPGAHYVHLPSVLADAGAHRPASDGALPLPRLASLQSALRDYGVNDDSRIVVYDNRAGLSAARAWWVLRWAGLSDVQVLDGGYGYWLEQGLPVSTDPPAVHAGSISLGASDGHRNPHLQTISTREAARFAQSGVLIDAREPRHFAGNGAGSTAHIPGAQNLPSSADVDEFGLLLPAEVLRGRAEQAGLRPGTDVAAYCGAGVLAAHKVLSLATLGIEASLYVGSWSAWAAEAQADVPPCTGL